MKRTKFRQAVRILRRLKNAAPSATASERLARVRWVIHVAGVR